MNVVLCSAVGLAFAPGAPALKDGPGVDRAALQGVWEVRAYTFDGVPVPPDALARAAATVRGDTLVVDPGQAVTVVPAGKVTFGLAGAFEARLGLDPGARPPAVDLRVGDGDEARVLRGIYRLDGGRLSLCFTTGADRPTEFRADKWSGRHLLELRRPER